MWLLLTDVMWPLEQVLRRQARQPEAPACFVIGPPRAGTSLPYELVVRRFHVAYLSNVG